MEPEYADALERSGAHQQARESLETLISLSIEVLGENHPDTRKAIEKLRRINAT